MKQQPSIKITIPEPCTRAWDDMQPVQGGRHCMHCQKVVVDFTRFTDAQLLAYFKTNSIGCRQFRNEQLGATIKEIEVPKSNWRARIAAGLLLAVGLSRMAEAQTTKHRSQTVQKHNYKKGQYQKKATVTVEGSYQPPIIDPETPGARIVRGAVSLEPTQLRPFDDKPATPAAQATDPECKPQPKKKSLWVRFTAWIK